MPENYKVADSNRWEWGRKEITIAENEMPGLMSLRKVSLAVSKMGFETLHYDTIKPKTEKMCKMSIFRSLVPQNP